MLKRLIFLVGLLVANPAIALTEDDIKGCEIPQVFRIEFSSAKVIAQSVNEGDRYLLFDILGRRYPLESNETVGYPAVYKLNESGCELVYLDVTGHATPLENVIPAANAQELIDQVRSD